MSRNKPWHSKWFLIFTVLGDTLTLSSCTLGPSPGCISYCHEVCLGQTPKTQTNTWSKPNGRATQGTNGGAVAPNQYPSVYRIPFPEPYRSPTGEQASGLDSAEKATRESVTYPRAPVPMGTEQNKPKYLPNIPGSTNCYPGNPSGNPWYEKHLSNPFVPPSGPVRQSYCWQRVAPKSWIWRPLQTQ